MIKGIDISKHNGNIDWDKVKADGIQFAIIRIGWGNDSKDQDDPTANRNMDECERLGIPYGVYIYSYALNEADAVSEAQHTLRMIKNRKVQMGMWFDMEDADDYKNKHKLPLDVAHKTLYTNICNKFCETIKNAGYSDVGVYSGKWVFENVAKAGPIHPNQWKSDSELFLRVSVKLAMLGSTSQQWGCFRGCLISINTLSFNKSAAEPHEISFPLPYCRIVYVYYGF